MNGFQWLNESSILAEGDDAVTLLATDDSDFFCGYGADSADGPEPELLTNAPFYFTEVTGDFILRARVTHPFTGTYDSASLMVMHDEQLWAKYCFEKTDFDTRAVVSVVTNGSSDDANGPNIAGDHVWLQVSRAGRAFAFHYSEDGEHFFMSRVFTLPMPDTVKVGFLAQAPTGPGGPRTYEQITLENRAVRNIRVGD